MPEHRERSRAAGGHGNYENRKYSFCFFPAPGGPDGSDEFQHAAFKGNKKKRRKQRGRRGSAAGIQEAAKNPKLRNRHANAAKR
jgi:hypothetical protein